MKDQPFDEQLNESQKRMKLLLDQERDDLHPAVIQQLQYARQRALGRYRKASHLIDFFRQPVVAVAVAAGLLVAIVSPSLLMQNHFPTLPAGVDSPEAELVVQLEYFEHDLAFYYWLEVGDGPAG